MKSIGFLNLNFKQLIFVVLVLQFSCEYQATKRIEHYIYFNRDRERIQDSLFLNTEVIDGAQLKYAWKELERKKNQYDFTEIEKDLAYLNRFNKSLFIQLQDVSFDTQYVNIPNYLQTEPKYNGGMNLQYDFMNEDETEYIVDGYVARRWDKAVAERFHLLLKKLGKQFDGRIAGINLPETAIGMGSKTDLHPKGFSFESYLNAIKMNMKIARESFQKSTVILYANFMPGEYRIRNDQLIYLTELYDYADEIGLGMGGPDILVYKQGQMANSYPLIRKSAQTIKTGNAVQFRNYDHINPKTSKQVTVKEIYLFAKDYLNLDYIFWSPQKPYYRRDVIPFLIENSN